MYGQETWYMDIFYQATLCRWTVLEVHTDGSFNIQVLVSFFLNLQGLPPLDDLQMYVVLNNFLGD